MFSFFVSRRQAFSGALAAAIFGFMLLTATPALVQAQTSGDAGPVLGRVAPGQQAGELEGTTESALTYVANVLFPLLTVAFLAYVVFALKSGRGWVTGAVCACLCLMLSGLTRLLEWHVEQGAGGIH
ncbi:MAG: hypothetical protein ACRD34_13640 [Bryobacteraceae bacterium]